MHPFSTLSLGASALCFSLCAVISSALADDSQLFGVADIDIQATPPGPQIVVRNIAGNHHISNVNLAVQGNSFAFGIGGYVECTGVQIENYALREGHLLSGGAFGIGRTSLLMSKALPDSLSINREGDMDAHTFQVPVALLANPQIDIDPAAIVMAAAEQAPSKFDYLRKDQVIEVKIPVRWEAQCNSYTHNKITKKTLVEADIDQVSYLTKDVTLKIKYQGDPQLFQMSAKLGGEQPGQFQVGDQPFKITSMSFQPDMPHYVGGCPDETTIRVDYMGQGRGEIRIRVNDGGQTIYNSPNIAFDAKDGKQSHEFEIAVPKPPQHQLNQTKHHNLQVYVSGKSEEEQLWPAYYQQMDAALWKHRCTPVMNPVLGGANTGQKGGYQQQGPGLSPVLPKRLQKPEPAPARPARQKIN
ncbi:hypothetical protein [Pelagibius sp.]|uniref:hypothetical protein n=1 Tax=Pelagibius sp. TaxID=1931238 RepID=UPI003B50C83A